MRHFSDDERRRRLARRHGLAPAHRYASPVAATTAMTVLHATEAASVHLALVARVDPLAARDVDDALYEQRTLVKQLAMRRTLFVFPRDLLAAAWVSAGARTAEFERRKIVKDLESAGVTRDGDAWLAQTRSEVLEVLTGNPLSARELKAKVPRLEQIVTLAPGTRWGGDFPVGSRVLGWLGARGDVVRGPNDGGWWVSRPIWSRTDEWLGGLGSGARRSDTGRELSAGAQGQLSGGAGRELSGDAQPELSADSRQEPSAGPRQEPSGEPEPEMRANVVRALPANVQPVRSGDAQGELSGEAAGYRELIRRWLWTFGPGTETDIVWWLGSTKSVVRRALAELDAAQVTLESGDVGWVLPDDLEVEPSPEPWAALVPSLDPTTMGWKQRDFYLHPADVPFLVDTAGNAGTTVWVEGRIVGCWIQDADGSVQFVLRSGVSRREQALLNDEARRLTRWLDGRVISSVYMARQRRGTLLP